MTDIVKQLRARHASYDGMEQTFGEAADEIERLRHANTTMALQSLDAERRLKAEIERLRADREAMLSRVWLMRAMCHTDKCECADNGGMFADYDACRLVSRHANGIISHMEGRDG